MFFNSSFSPTPSLGLTARIGEDLSQIDTIQTRGQFCLISLGKLGSFMFVICPVYERSKECKTQWIPLKVQIM